MKTVTIIYQPRNGHSKRAKLIENATTEKIQRFLSSKKVFMLDHIVVHHKTIGINDFKLYTSQDDLIQFAKEWDLED